MTFDPTREPQPPSESADAISVPDLLQAIRRHVLLLVLPTLAVGGFAGWLAWRTPDMYGSSAVVRIVDGRRALTGTLEAVAAEKMLGSGTDPVYSQLQILRGRTLLSNVVHREGLRLDATALPGVLRDVRVDTTVAADTLRLRFGPDSVLAQLGDATASGVYGSPLAVGGVEFTLAAAPSIEYAELPISGAAAAVDALLHAVRTRTRDKTDVITVEVRHLDPLVAQRVANAVVEEFRTASALSAQQDARRRRVFLEEQLAKTQVQLAEAQAALGGFRRREQVLSSRDKFAAEQASMTGTQEQLGALQAQRQIYSSLLQKLGSSDPDKMRAIMAAPGAAENPALAQMYRQLVQYETAYDTLRTGRFRAAATDPEVQRLVTLIAATERNIGDAVRGELTAIDARISALSTRLQQAGRSIQNLPAAEAEEGRLVQRLESIQRIAIDLASEYQKASIAEVVEAGQVEILDQASLPLEPLPAHRPLKAAVGLVIGLLLGGAGVFLRERTNVSLRRIDEIQPLLGVPSFGVIPRFDRRRKATSSHNIPARLAHELVAVRQYDTVAAESYRILRMHLMFSGALEKGRVLAVTSATPQEGKTTTAANLAVACAQAGQRVLLVDADLRRPRVNTLFGITNAEGLGDLLVPRGQPKKAVAESGVRNLWVMPAGTSIANPAEVLGQLRVQALVATLRQRFDLVIIDCPPVLVAPDAPLLARLADGVLLVVRAGQPSRTVLSQALQHLERSGTRVLGAALNDPDAVAKRYAGSGYYADKYGYYATRSA